MSPERVWPVLLLNGLWLASLAVSAMFFLASQRLAGARWSAGLRRIPEAVALTLPVGAAILLATFAGAKWVFPWSRPGAFSDAPALAGMTKYLELRFVFVRAVAILATWLAFARLFRRVSLQQDRDPGRSLACHQRLNRWSAVFAVAFAVTFTISCYDWALSIEPGWFSTIFAIYLFSGSFVQGIAAVTLAAVVLRHQVGATAEQFHDLGKMLFAFSAFWAYLWTCQYLLIWYGNIPDEITYYLRRINGPWVWPFGINLAVNWVVPFVALLSATAKRNPAVLRVVATILLAGHWLDLYVLIGPSVWRAPMFGAPEVLITSGCVVLTCLIFGRSFSAAPSRPRNDPVILADRWLRMQDRERLEDLAAGAGQ